MLDVVIDTSIFRNRPKRDSPAFRALSRLLKGNAAHLNIPHFIKREFITQQQERVRKNLKDIADQASSILDLTSQPDLVNYAKSASELTNQQIRMVNTRAEAEFNEWLEEVDAEEFPITEEQARRVAIDYFGGLPPYSSVKSRNDIPDSFIFNSILDIAEQCGDLHAVIADNRLREAVAKIPGIIVHRSLEDFVESPDCQTAIRELSSEILDENIEHARDLLETRHQLLSDTIHERLDRDLPGRTIKDDEIPGFEPEATIIGIDHAGEVAFDFDTTSYYGETDIGIPLDVKIRCTLEYPIYKGEYYLTSRSSERRRSVEERNEHYFTVREQYLIQVSAVLILKLKDKRLDDITLSNEDLERAIDNAEFSFDIKELEIC